MRARSGVFVVTLRIFAVAAILASAEIVHGRSGQRPDVAGNYRLVSANGQALPAVVSENGSTRQEVVGGSVRLAADGTFVWETLYRYSARGGARESQSRGRGDYVLRGESLFLSFAGDASRREVTLDGDTLTIPADVPMVYRKVDGREETPRRSTPPSTAPSRRTPPFIQRPSSQPPASLPAGEPPPPASGAGVTWGLSLPLGDVPPTFQDLCDASELIVEAHVQSVLAPTENLRYLETDSILSVDQVLKGPGSIQQVVISQKGGALDGFTQRPHQYNLMRQGEHYILFLTAEPATHLPDIPGVPRYALTGSWTGMFQIDEPGVHLSPATAAVIREQFDGGSAQDVIREIQRCSQ